MHSLPGVGLIR